MERKIDMSQVSDGRLYTSRDMVKADCGGCQGCSQCCRDMGQSIVLDPYDIFMMTKSLSCSFEELLAGKLELRVADGMILPNIKMAGEEACCSFLDENGRCGIHSFRPGFCRLFPLGRIYENRDFRYFLQIHECPKENKTKVKVKNWLGILELDKYEQFIRDWHYFLKDTGESIGKKGEEGFAKTVNMKLLTMFYLTPYDGGRDFYGQFYERLQQILRIFSE